MMWAAVAVELVCLAVVVWGLLRVLSDIHRLGRR